jgi:hypothetical protein
MGALYLYKNTAKSRNTMFYRRFGEEDVTRISGSAQLIPQTLLDTLR